MSNTKNSSNNNGNNSGAVDQQLGMLGLLAVGAIIWHNEQAIRLWLYQNILSLILGGITVLALVGMYFWNRYKKKEEEFIERRKGLRQVHTNQSTQDYYKRKGH